MFKETIATYYQNQAKHICGQNAELFNVKTGAHSTLNC
jgi:hypothetical protein